MLEQIWNDVRLAWRGLRRSRSFAAIAVAPLASTVRNPAFREGVMNELRVVARLRPGVSVGEAARELTILAPRIEDGLPRADAVRVDLYVVLFTALAAFIAAACAAAPPAVLATRARLAIELANGGRTVLGHRLGRAGIRRGRTES